MEASLIFHNARVFTRMEPSRPHAEAVAVAGDRLLAVGSQAWVARHRGPRTRLIDGGGLTLLPGFIDAHCHVLSYAASLLSIDCSPRAVRSIADIQATLAAAAARTPEGRWLRAVGYDEVDLAEGRHPTRWDLDTAAPSHPVRLLHRTGRACVLSSRAMSVVGLGASGCRLEATRSARRLASPPAGSLTNDQPLQPPLPYEALSAGVRSGAGLRRRITAPRRHCHQHPEMVAPAWSHGRANCRSRHPHGGYTRANCPGRRRAAFAPGPWSSTVSWKRQSPRTKYGPAGRLSSAPWARSPSRPLPRRSAPS
jgi:hypothetical protein